MVRLRVVALCAALAPTLTSSSNVTPLNKVIEMLNDLTTKGTAEKHAEEVEFAKFSEFCKDAKESTRLLIKEAAAQIIQLSADISKAEADAEQAGKDATDLQGMVDKDTADMKAAQDVRKKEKADYDAIHADLSESIEAIEKAITTLRAKEKDTPGSLLQLQQAADIPAETKATIESFLHMASENEMEAPKAHAYQNQSGGIVGILEKLRLKFQDQRKGVEQEELNTKHNHQVLMQALTAAIKENTQRANDKTALKAQRLEDAATAKGDKKATENVKAEDETRLSDLLTDCDSRSKEYEQNQVTRFEELKAIAKAKEILLSPDVSGAADTHLPKLIQYSNRGAALLQLRGGDSPKQAEERENLTKFLRGRAEKLGSRYLSLVAEHASADPFVKVKKMIKDLIVKLMEEANAEADSKAFCDAELAKNKMTRDNKGAEVEELTAKSEKLTTLSVQLADEISKLTEAVADSRRQQAEATKLRAEEKVINEKTIQEAQVAQVAVNRAIKVLQDFYNKKDDSSLLQGKISQAMQAASQEPYTGMTSSSGGIIGMLEVILSDFGRLEAETASAEDSAASNHQKFMDEEAQDVAVKETEIEHKAEKKQDTDATNADTQKELQLTQEELDAALAYYDKLKPTCIDTGLSYEDRVRMRKEEIQSLKEALEILSQQDLD